MVPVVETRTATISIPVPMARARQVSARTSRSTAMGMVYATVWTTARSSSMRLKSTPTAMEWATSATDVQTEDIAGGGGVGTVEIRPFHPLRQAGVGQVTPQHGKVALVNPMRAQQSDGLTALLF